jgi:hypothetical protein
MPHSIRTRLLIHQKKNFELFLKENNLDNILVGSYQLSSAISGLPFGSSFEDCICYAYINNDDDTPSLLSFIILKFGSIEKAFIDYLTTKI